MRILIQLAYDGNGYHGWQRQSNAITVQQIVEECLSKLFGKRTVVVGASRTDAGVHAIAQMATFDSDMRIPIDKLPYAINSFLPDDIIVTKAQNVTQSFHPRYDAKQKTYQYMVFNAEFMFAQCRNLFWHVPHELDMDLLYRACNDFIGEHDFASFYTRSNKTPTSTLRRIFDFTMIRENSRLVFKITGNGFLYNMVRIMIGTVIDIARGKLLSDVPTIMNERNRIYAGRTAPPQGLTLFDIVY